MTCLSQSVAQSLFLLCQHSHSVLSGPREHRASGPHTCLLCLWTLMSQVSPTLSMDLFFYTPCQPLCGRGCLHVYAIPPCVPRCTCISLCLCSVRGHLPDRSSHLHIPVSHSHPHPHPRDAELMDFAVAPHFDVGSGDSNSSPHLGREVLCVKSAALSQENLEPF